jgi:hypothetical protein
MEAVIVNQHSENAIPYTNSFFSLGISETPPISICTDC